MRHSYQIQYKRVFLRPLSEGDLETLRILRNRNRFCFHTTAYIHSVQQKEWFQQYLDREDDVMFAVELAGAPGEFVGAVALYHIDRDAGTAEFGRTLIDKEKAPERGIGTEAVLAVCRIAFEELGIERVTAEVLKGNERARRAYAKAGCTWVGEDRDSWRLEITPGELEERL